jgi:subtilisin family serine protease
MADPLDGKAGCCRLHIQNIEANRTTREFRMRGQQMPCGALDLALLAPVDAGSAAAVVAAGTQADLGNDQNTFSSSCDDVELTGAATIVARKDGEALLLQISRCGGFCRVAGLDVSWSAGVSQSYCAAGSAGWTAPSRPMRAQLSVRSTRPSGVSFRRPVTPGKAAAVALLRMATASEAASNPKAK